MKYLKALRLYFWVMAAIFPIILWLDITDGDPLSVINYLDYMFWALALAGVFACSYSKNILNVSFWKLFLPFKVMWDTFFMFDSIVKDPEMLTEEYGTGYIILAELLYLVFILPEYIAIYLYGYKHTIMVEKNFDLQEKELKNKNNEHFLKPAYKPWYIYLMAFWAFFSIAGLSIGLVKYLYNVHQQIEQIVSIILLGLAAVFAAYIIKMNRIVLIAFGVYCASIATLFGFYLLIELFFAKQANPTIYSYLFIIVPSIILSIISLRQRFLFLADQYSKFKHQ